MNLEALKRNSSNFTHRVVNSELTIQEIELKKIIPDPNQPRKEFDPEQLSELAESIKEHGLIQPIVLRKISADQYVVIAGERRFRAVSLNGSNTIKAIVKNSVDEEKLGYFQIAENLQRANLTTAELAEFVCSRIDFGESQTDIAKKIGQPKSLISKFATWAEMPQCIKDAVRAKKINSIQTAYVLFKTFLTHPDKTQLFIESKETVTQSDANSFDPSRKPAEEEEMQEQRQEEQGAVEESSLETEETTKTETGSDTDIDFEEGSETESKVEADSQDDNNADEGSEVGSDDEAFNDEEKTTETEPLENFGSEEFSNDVEKATDDFLEANEPNLLFKKPLILCLVEGRECELLYKRKSSFGVFVKWDDGVEEEIPAEDVQINRIVEA
ncbi:ParB/RepB/Spo0J family partition protein [uncultured Parasutterella sp.]|uniref:ParB/RepB/Spo0J family partition protein n=1 Tax=uncultured Parasutterella sp. TaxID=1263098 RepID=UPI00258D4667|nr:ParB/RepB/Spo0J family partition protein [uncultured Parasutterella sp.]